MAMAGTTWPPVPPPAMTAQARAAPSAPAHDCLAMLASIPAPNRAMTSDDPPNDTNGSGTPVTGQQADHGTDVDDRLADQPGGDAGRHQGGVAGRGPAGDPGSDQGQGQEQPGEDQPPEQARSPRR